MVKPIFQVKKEKETADYGLFTIEPLPRGYGDTLGNSLRRVLLTSLSGAAAVQIKIKGVRHKFSTLAGLKEDVIEFILNVKQIRIKYAGKKPVKFTLEKSGPGEIKASDIKVTGGAEIVNQNLILGHLADRKSKLKAEMTVESGWGYVPAEEKTAEKLGVIPVDAIFSPVLRVNYRVEETRVGRETGLDRLILEVTTDGTIKPSEAVKEASQLLVDFFSQLVKPKRVKIVKKSKKLPNEALKLTLEEINIPTRIANSLRRAGFETVGDLAKATVADLARVKNLGEKSIEVIQAALSQKNLKLKEKKK